MRHEFVAYVAVTVLNLRALLLRPSHFLVETGGLFLLALSWQCWCFTGDVMGGGNMAPVGFYLCTTVT